MNNGRKLFQEWKAADRPTPAEDWLHLGGVNPDAGPQFPAETQTAEGDDSSDPTQDGQPALGAVGELALEPGQASCDGRLVTVRVDRIRKMDRPQ